MAKGTVKAGIVGGMCLALSSFFFATVAGASTPLPSAVGQVPVSWTPNVSAGPTVGNETFCDATMFGAGNLSCQSEVYSTAYVNGDVVVAGAFTKACQPGTLKEGLCAPGTQVTRNDIFAYKAGSGLIDPSFVPILNAGPAWAVLAGAGNTVYVAGGFTTVDGTGHKGLVELNVNPGVTTGPTADGSIVATFGGGVNNFARTLALSPDGTSLYVGGQFTSVDNITKFANGFGVDGIARLNATTGTLDTTFEFSISGSVASGTPVKLEAMTLSPDGTHLAFSGSFLKVNGMTRERLAIVNTGTTYLGQSALSDWTAPILDNGCSLQHDYVRGLDFSPDGTFIVAADTGLDSDGSTPYAACDAAVRFDVTAADTTATGKAVDVPPAWIDYSGGDSFYSVAIAGGIVYVGGHARWANNYCGNNYVCGPNAELIAGLGALDANTGIALAWWHPLTLRGDGTMYLSTFPAGTYDGSHAGLALGTDVDNVAGTYHSEEALFPIAAATSSTSGGPIPSGMFNEEGGSTLSNLLCVDATGNSSTSGTAVGLDTCTNAAEQNWNIVPDGTIEINGLCLSPAGDALLNSTPVVVSSCDGTAAQQWSQGAGETLINTGSGKCLTDPGSSTREGVQLQIASCSSSSGGNQVWPLPSAQGPPPPPPTGEIFSREVQANTQVPCVDDLGDKAAPANPIQLKTCVGNSEQSWTITPDSSDSPSFTIELAGTSYCLDSSSSTTKGTVPAVLNLCSGSTSQQWTGPSVTGNNYYLQNTGATTLNKTAYCLVDPSANSGTANGTIVDIANCSSSTSVPFDAHAWRLPAV